MGIMTWFRNGRVILKTKVLSLVFLVVTGIADTLGKSHACTFLTDDRENAL